MHSRIIAFLTILSFSCLIIAGSIVIHISLASAANPGTATSPRASEFAQSLQDEQSETTPLFFSDAPAENPEAAAPPMPSVSEEHIAQADSLQRLLTKVHVLFHPSSAEINDAMIPFLANIITYINQVDEITYRIDLYEPEVVLSRRRAQTLSDVLRLNVLTPSCLIIAGHEGSHGVRVSVST